MKKIFVILAWVFVVGMFLYMGMDLASADTPKVPKDTVIKVPGAGKDVIVEVPYTVQRIHEVSPAEGNLRLRGGLSAGIGHADGMRMSYTGGLIGEIGFAGSPWRLQGTFRAGNCNTGEKGMALNSGLAVMHATSKHLRMGLGADLLYCSNIYDAPKEKASERVVGGSLRLELVDGRFSVAATAGGGAATAPIPGGRETKPALYGGLTLSYLWGK